MLHVGSLHTKFPEEHTSTQAQHSFASSANHRIHLCFHTASRRKVLSKIDVGTWNPSVRSSTKLLQHTSGKIVTSVSLSRRCDNVILVPPSRLPNLLLLDLPRLPPKSRPQPEGCQRSPALLGVHLSEKRTPGATNTPPGDSDDSLQTLQSGSKEQGESIWRGEERKGEEKRKSEEERR
eukprot:758704-Hanusia_phi.AAC.2